MSAPGPQTPEAAGAARRQRRVAYAAAAVCVAMLGLSFAASPLYRMFCAATGYGGTTQVAHAAPAARGERQMTVRFDANVAPGLPWRFEPETTQISLRPGQTATAFFRAQNRSGAPLAAIASYNVGPDGVGVYFNKISCFCFDEIMVGPGETVELPVVFFLDPALEKDKTLAGVETVVLSYTVFPARAERTKQNAARFDRAAGAPL
ncbi:cytochrome c oxidase assembly protein [Methylocella sp.]|uniref:cytochrome c oxidase assembly protein n=1 Tax=Methylocella sp. TaxID=1978226 RepID=UPI0037843146